MSEFLQKQPQRRRSDNDNIYDEPALGSTPGNDPTRVTSARKASQSAQGMVNDIDSLLADNSNQVGAANGYSPDDIGGREANSSIDPSFYKGDKQEGAALADAVKPAGAAAADGALGGGTMLGPEKAPDTLGKGFTAGEQAGTSKGFGQVVKGFMSRRSTKVGGGVGGAAALTLAFFALTGTQLEILNIRNNLLTRGRSGIINTVLQDRRNRNFYKFMTDLNGGKLKDKLSSDKVKGKLEAQGFLVEAKDGKITGLHYEKDFGNGKSGFVSADLTAKDAQKQLLHMFNDPILGPEVSLKMNKAMGDIGTTWKGKAARILYGRLKVFFTNWLDRTPSEKATTPESQYADNERHATVDQAEEASLQGVASDSQLQQDAKNEVLTKDVEQAIQDGQQYQQDMLNDPNNKGLAAGGEAAPVVGATMQEMAKNGGNFSAAISKIAASGAAKALMTGFFRSFSALGYQQTACQINGTLKFVSNMNNILMTILVAKTFWQFANAADDNKAHVVTSNGLKLLELYLNNPSALTGKVATQSGGYLKDALGDKNARVNQFNVAHYGVSRAPRGLLQYASTYVNDAMKLFGGSKGCKIVNNGFVQAGAFVIGIGAAIFSGGSTAVAESIASISFGLAGQILLGVGKAKLEEMGASMVETGYESGEQAGDLIFGAGGGAALGMIANANGLRPSTIAQLAPLAAEAKADQQLALSQESVFDRYFSLTNGTSAVASMATTILPYELHPATFANALIQDVSKLPNMLFSMFVPTVSADGPDASCDDPEYPIIASNNLQTDSFCNLEYASTPDLDLDTTEQVLKDNNQIDDTGAATAGSEYSRYIDLCMSGRPGILYQPTVADNGNDDGPATFDYDIGGGSEPNPCIVSGKPLPGDPGDPVTDNNGTVTGHTKAPGRFDRYAEWYGKSVDEVNFIESMTDNYADNTLPTNDVSIGNPYAPDPNAKCDPSTNDLGVQTGYVDGQAVQIKVCGIPNIPSSGEESTPGSPYYVNGANGDAIVNANVSGNFYKLGVAAKNSNITLRSDSSYRTMAHQQALCNANYDCNTGNYAYVAKPGTSNHQMGLAVDFVMPTKPNDSANCVMSSSGVCTLPNDPVWQWLTNNAANQGLFQYAKEFWHWSVTGT